MRVTLLSIHDGEIQAMNGDVDKGDRLPVDAVVSDVSTGDVDARTAASTSVRGP